MFHHPFVLQPKVLLNIFPMRLNKFKQTLTLSTELSRELKSNRSSKNVTDLSERQLNYSKGRCSLPPISQAMKSLKQKISERNTEVLSRICTEPSKSIESHRYASGPLKIISQKMRPNQILCEQIRMKPVQRYFHKMGNIRLAERLLFVRPTLELQKEKLNRFYLQQQHYSSQISKVKLVLRQRKMRGFKKRFTKWIE